MNIVNRTYCSCCHHADICKNRSKYESVQKELDEVITSEISPHNSDMWIVLEERCAHFEEIGER